MDNVKDDKYYVNKIIADLDFLIEKTKGNSKDDINSDEVLQDSILFRFIQIAENASKLSESIKRELRAIPWSDIKGLRNRIVHDYGKVDFDIVYDTLVNDIVDMRDVLKKSI